MKREVIIALDFKDREETLRFLEPFHDERIFVKIGMELYYKEGQEIVKELKGRGYKLFLDLKSHDIPNTVKQAMKQFARLEVDLVTLHASGGIDMMKAAMEGLEEGSVGHRPKCVAITQLTSISDEILSEELWIDKPLNDVIVHYAKNASKAGLDGVVCSPLEAGMVHDAIGDAFLTVTPGIRLTNDDNQDQKRVTTPKDARTLGSNYIVVGRSITQAKDPLAVYHQIKKDFSEGVE